MAERENEARVLVVDDDRSIRQLVSTIVRRERFLVDCAADGQEAIDLLTRREYPVILLDLMMPRLDGFAVIEHLRRNPPARKPIVLVMTAYADQKFKQVDPNVVAGVLRKPFEVAELGGVVRLCMNGYESETKSSLYAGKDRSGSAFGRNQLFLVPNEDGGDNRGTH